MSEFSSTHQFIGAAARARDAAARLLVGLGAQNCTKGWPEGERKRLLAEVEEAQNTLALVRTAIMGEVTT